MATDVAKDEVRPATSENRPQGEIKKEEHHAADDTQIQQAEADLATAIIEKQAEKGVFLEDFPTEEELRTLRRVADHIPLKVFTIAFIELCERFSYYGTTIVCKSPFPYLFGLVSKSHDSFTDQNYIQWPLPKGSNTGAGGPDGQSGALGMGQRAGTGLTTFNQFWNYILPLAGAYIADTYWGRFKTICVALAVDIIGHIILVISSIPPVITKSHNSLAALVMAILVIGLGTGGFKPNINPLVIEQLKIEHMKVRTLKSGERVIVDPAITVNRVYNWFYLFTNVGALVGQLTMVYAEKYKGFYLAFLLPTSMLAICPLVMWWARKRYARRPPAGSAIPKAFKTFGLANKGRWHLNPVRTFRHLRDGTFWESVKPSKFAPGTKPKWMTFDDAWVDELRRGFSACAVFFYLPIFWLTYGQINNNLISQAAVMKLNGLPNDIFTNLDPIALIIFIPICDFLLYPALRRMKVRFTPIRRISAGFITGSFAMVWAAVVQYYIYKQSECGTHASGKLPNGERCAPVGINVWAQTGSYVLIALSEIMTIITSFEYAYSKAPKNMRSIVQAVMLCQNAISSAIAEAFVSLSEDPLLVWNYGSMAVLAFLAGCLFWLHFRHLDYEEDELNELPEGKLFADQDEESLRGAEVPNTVGVAGAAPAPKTTGAAAGAAAATGTEN